MELKKLLNEMKAEESSKRLFEDRKILLEADLVEIDDSIFNSSFVVVLGFSIPEYKKNIRGRLEESTNWKPASANGYWYRVDPPRPENQNHYEICIAHKNNLSSPPQFTWKDDLTRKDRHKFTREPNRTVKNIAANFFNVDASLLEVRIYKPGKRDSGFLLDQIYEIENV